jgi:CRP-like cAMP-binding protein
MQTVTTEWLQSIESLKSVPAEQLQWLIDNSRHYELAEGEFLFKSGEPLTGTHVILKGRIRISLIQNKGVRNIGFFEANDITGYLPFSRGISFSVDGEVIEPAQVMTFTVERIKELIDHHSSLHRRWCI